MRSYDFNFGFVIPNSTNSWEAVYPVPPLSDEECASCILQRPRVPARTLPAALAAASVHALLTQSARARRSQTST